MFSGLGLPNARLSLGVQYFNALAGFSAQPAPPTGFLARRRSWRWTGVFRGPITEAVFPKETGLFAFHPRLSSLLHYYSSLFPCGIIATYAVHEFYSQQHASRPAGGPIKHLVDSLDTCSSQLVRSSLWGDIQNIRVYSPHHLSALIKLQPTLEVKWF